MKLIGAVSEGSGTHNEDAIGVIEKDGVVVAAWVFDGVTGINDRNYLDAPSDAAWFVAKANEHLRSLGAQDIALPELLRRLVDKLKKDWNVASSNLSLPQGYDFPATCLLFAKRYADGWQVLRLGDSFLLTKDGPVKRWDAPESDLSGLESELRREAHLLRNEGITEFKLLLQNFHAQHMQSRLARNTPGNHSILLADESSLAIPEYFQIGWPEKILLCSDGFYRAVDTYGMMDDAAMMAACAQASGVQNLLNQIRAIEKGDPLCIKHLRFKPADDASAIMLSTH